MYINHKTGCLATGGSKDNGTYKELGDKKTPILEFSLAVGKDEQGGTKWINCKAWEPIASRFRNRIKKGEKYLISGGWEKREYNGNDYYTLVVDFIVDMTQLSSSVADNNASSNSFSFLEDDMGDMPDFMK